jgi:hypothetical protein
MEVCRWVVVVVVVLLQLGVQKDPTEKDGAGNLVGRGPATPPHFGARRERRVTLKRTGMTRDFGFVQVEALELWNSGGGGQTATSHRTSRLSTMRNGDILLHTYPSCHNSLYGYE